MQWVPAVWTSLRPSGGSGLVTAPLTAFWSQLRGPLSPGSFPELCPVSLIVSSSALPLNIAVSVCRPLPSPGLAVVQDVT